MYSVHHNIPADCNSDYLQLRMTCVCYLLRDPTAQDRRKEGGERRCQSGNFDHRMPPEAQKDFRFILQ